MTRRAERSTSTALTAESMTLVGDAEMEELKSPFLRLQRVMSDIVVGEQGSSKATALFLVSCTIGAGTLALPCAFTEVGIGGGFTLLLLSAVGNAYCLYLLTDAAEICKSFTYEGIARKVLGPVGLRVVQACLLIVLFGIITTQIILIADSLVAIMDVVWPCPSLPASPSASNVSVVWGSLSRCVLFARSAAVFLISSDQPAAPATRARSSCRTRQSAESAIRCTSFSRPGATLQLL